MGGKTWSDADLEYLEQLIETHSVKEIADVFDRSASSIYNKIKEIKSNDKTMRRMP